jgi:hypothetical protein
MLDIKTQIYDEKVNMVINQLGLGKSREKLAEELGYTTYKSIDMYMRRKNFKWDSQIQNYIPDSGHKKYYITDEASIPTSKAYTVISLFDKNKPTADPRAIARLAGFRDHLEMAGYMKSKNYKWDSVKQNYVQEIVNKETTEDIPKNNIDVVESKGTEDYNTEFMLQNISNINEHSLERFIPLLEILEKHKNELINTIVPERDEAIVPRYIIPGVYITKSVHMANNLDRLVREFSREKNISQRDIFEVALISFFRQYGYRKEINAILNK